MYQGFGDELIYRPRLSCGLSGTMRFSVYVDASASIDLKGAMFLRRIFVHGVHAH
jgi:hypothetical protein